MNITKYNASGNDFVIFHTLKKANRSHLAVKLCDRINGVGGDGLVVLVPNENCDFEWEFYNSDGSIASMCGNASRAVAHYAYDKGISNNRPRFMTGAGIINAEVQGDIVESQLTLPKELKSTFHENGLEWYMVDTGVPHLVTIVDDLEIFSNDVARELRYKYNANVNYAKVENGKLFVRTYERGVEDETLACGTGMAASFLYANNLKLLGNISKVFPKSGEELQMKIVDGVLFFKGEVNKVFTTDVDIK